MKRLFILLCVAFIVAGCTITEKVVFNSKNGGNISYELDGSEFAGFMEAMDSTGKPFNFGDSLAELGVVVDGLNKIKGISNVDFKTDSKKMSISFSFADLQALNQAHLELGKQTELTQSTPGYQKVNAANKKEWIYRTLPLGDSPNDSTYLSMGLMLTYKLDVTFPRAVKSVDGKNITTDDKRIQWSSSAEDPGAAFAFEGIKVQMK